MPEDLSFNLNIADIILGWLTLASVLAGFVRGAVRDTMSTTSWLVATAFSFVLAPVFAALLEPWLPILPLRFFVAGGAIWIAVMMTVRLLAHILAILIAEVNVRGLDRMLGILFGAARAFVLAVVLLGLGKPYFNKMPWWQDSEIIKVLAEYEEPVSNVLEAVNKQHKKMMRGNGG